MPALLPANATLGEIANIGSVLTLDGTHSRAQIALHGAHVLSFTAKSDGAGNHPVLWLSGNASGLNGKAIRGGVPLCAPWFGPHPSMPSAPMHGLVRIRLWDISEVVELPDGSIRATFTQDLPPCPESGWEHKAVATFIITAGKTLRMELAIRNTGATPIPLTNAMHTYFAVSDVRNVRVEGLDDTDYLDFSGDKQNHHHGIGPKILSGEAAHMFYTGRPVHLIDPGLGRALDIRGHGAATTVVWNPWDKAAAKVDDIGAQWPEYICVENANIPNLTVLLAPGATHRLGTEISISRL